MLTTFIALLQAAAGSPVYSGIEHQTTVRVPRREAVVVIDGALDEPVWSEAAVLTGFSQYAPVDGRPAADSTEALVWYSETAIYVGIRAFEAHGAGTGGAVHATLADRDKIGADDYVQLLIDTFNDHRQALVFGVNPLGVQADGTLSEGSQSRSGGLTGNLGAVRDTVDLSADFVYESKGRITGAGYQVELRIPFKSIRYQSAAEQVWGINVVRQVQHSGYQDTWTPARRAGASFLGQSGTLAGLTGLRRGVVVDVTPEVTAKSNEDPQAGATVRWGVSNNLTLNGTAHPDFSQVEADAGQIVFDPRNALFFPEKRPFFLEGLEYFAAPSQLIYTRRLVQPVAAAKLTGKVAATNVAALVGLDDSPGNPAYAMLRVRRDLPGQSTVGLVLTDQLDGSDYNHVIGPDARIVLGKVYSVSVQGVESFTRAGGRTINAPLWNAAVDRNGRSVAFHYGLSGIHQDFQDRSGFISRPGIVVGTADQRITLFGRPGSLIESWTGDVFFLGRWLYPRFTAGRPPDDREFHLNSDVRLRGGWVFGASVFFESFGYDSSLYSGYAVERHTATVDTVPFVGTPHIRNLDVVFTLATPQFSTFSGTLLFLPAPQDENFFEWAPARVLIVDAEAAWRPSAQVRVAASYVAQQYWRKTDGSVVGYHRIPRLKVEYQVSRPLFLRLVGQYDAQFQDSLRDDSRTNDPLLIRDATGTYVRAQRRISNGLRLDWLLAYRPTPGTVVFAGYGESLTDAGTFQFRNLDRTSDGFFLKVSYLLRM
jgi:uncharacterized protein DUF5916